MSACSQLSYALLADRGVLEVAGEDRVAFLQGLVSNDVTKAGPGRALYAALLTPQGKYLHDFFIVGSRRGVPISRPRRRGSTICCAACRSTSCAPR